MTKRKINLEPYAHNFIFCNSYMTYLCVYLKILSETMQYLSPVSESYDTDVSCYQPWPVFDIIEIFV